MSAALAQWAAVSCTTVTNTWRDLLEQTALYLMPRAISQKYATTKITHTRKQIKNCQCNFKPITISSICQLTTHNTMTKSRHALFYVDYSQMQSLQLNKFGWVCNHPWHECNPSNKVGSVWPPLVWMQSKQQRSVRDHHWRGCSPSNAASWTWPTLEWVFWGIVCRIWLRS